jgi:antirestriction protein ArdC
MLWMMAEAKGYAAPIWMTFKQAKELGGHVRKGEKASPVVYAGTLEKTEQDQKTGEDIDVCIRYMKSYSAFNVEQIEGLPEHYYAPAAPQIDPVERIEQADAFAAHTGARIDHGGDRAFYAPGPDRIQLPPFVSFQDAESYYATLLHELTHWTRHETRLDRSFGRKTWGDEGYAREELVAELGAAFLCADLGITPEPREDHAAYLGHWLGVLKEDKRAIFQAAAHAQRAADFLKGLQPKTESGEIAEPTERAA